MNRIFKITAIFLFIIISPSLIYGESALQLLKEADQRMHPFEDQSYSCEVKLYEGDNLIKTYKFEVILKGKYKQLIHFTAPGEIRGMKVLTLDPETMYVYMPQFKRVRRIATHVRNTSFLGTDLSYADMAEQTFSDRWDGKILESTKSYWKLELTPKKETDTEYSKIVVYIDRKYKAPTKFEYYKGETKVKTQLRENWNKVKDQFLPTKLTMITHKKNTRTEIYLKDLKVNTGVSDSIFSTRTLLKGE